MPLAQAIASASSVNGCTVMTGPKISRWIISSSWRRPATTVGSRKKPGRSGSLPPVTISAWLGLALEEALDALALARGVERPERRVSASSVSPMT